MRRTTVDRLKKASAIAGGTRSSRLGIPTAAEGTDKMVALQSELLVAKVMYRVEQMVDEYNTREGVVLTEEQRAELCNFIAEVGR